MKIAVFGWYGNDNAGDERIKYCLSFFLKGLGGIDSVDFYDLHEEAIQGPTSKFDDYNLVIIGGGGLIFSRHNYHDFIMGINTKMVTLGISVETDLKGNPKKFVMALLEKSDAFLVRDTQSKIKIQPLDKKNLVRVSADLTFLKPYDFCDLVTPHFIGINLLPKPMDIQYSTLASHSLNFCIRLLNKIGIKNFIRMVDHREVVSALESISSLMPIPLYCIPQNEDCALYQMNDVQYLKKYCKNVADHFSDHLIDQCSVFVSMRLHGAIFSVQKGIPVVSFSYLPKNKNFMTEAGLQDFVVDSNNPKKIIKVVNHCLEKRDVIHRKMIDFTGQASDKIREDLSGILHKVL